MWDLLQSILTVRSSYPSAQQWSFPTTSEDELIPALPLNTHSAVKMLHDSALYKFMIDIDIQALNPLQVHAARTASSIS